MNINKWIWSIVLLSIFIIDVHANDVFEDIDVLYEDDLLSDIYVTYSVLDNSKEIRVISNVFKELTFMNKEYINDIDIHINIDNDYYVKEINFNYLDYLDISPKSYFCFNDAILALDDSYNKTIIYWKLLSNGFISLEKYYLYYYNNKYNLNIRDIEDFPTYVLDDLFSGECLVQYTNNNHLNSLAERYLLDNVFYIKWDGIKYPVKDLIGNSIISDKLNFTVGYEEDYMHDSLRDFGYNIYMDILLIKKEGDVLPPNTGI